MPQSMNQRQSINTATHQRERGNRYSKTRIVAGSLLLAVSWRFVPGNYKEELRCSSKIKPRLCGEWVVLSEDFSLLESCFLRPLLRNSVLEELWLRVKIKNLRFGNIEEEICLEVGDTWVKVTRMHGMRKVQYHLCRGGTIQYSFNKAWQNANYTIHGYKNISEKLKLRIESLVYVFVEHAGDECTIR